MTGGGEFSPRLEHSHQATGMEASFAALRSEQMTAIAGKLGKALEAGSKRIEIKY